MGRHGFVECRHRYPLGTSCVVYQAAMAKAYSLEFLMHRAETAGEMLLWALRMSMPNM
jgi:hypothetical protein